MSERPRVVVTGMGIVAANGHGLDTFSKALQEGKSGLRYDKRLEDLKFACRVSGIPQGVLEKIPEYFSQDEIPAVNENIAYSSIAAIDAFKDAGLKIPARDEDFVYDDTGAIIGTGIGGIDTLTDKVVPMTNAGKVKRLGSTIVEQIMASAVSAKIGGIFGLGNQVTTNSAACSTGTEAVIMGTERIRAGLAKRMIVGGTEGTHINTWGGFDSMRVLCRKFNDNPETASRPMSATAAGFIPAGGAGMIIIEDLETAKARGAKIYAEVIGATLNCGGMRYGGSMTAPSARSVQACVRAAVLDAKIQPKEIQYINGHLTATMADTLEPGNWAKALEIPPSELPYINSTKSLIGHGLGATGGIECVATLLQLRDGFIHPSLNCEDLHPDLEPFAKSVVHETIREDISVAAKASFGFGDVNSCIIFRKWRN